MTQQDDQYQSAIAAWRAGRETRAIVTPFAFKIDEQLIGKPLARPIRRAMALLCDSCLVATLSDAPNLMIAFAAAVAVWIISKRHDQVVFPWARRWLRIIGGAVAFMAALSLVELVSDRLPQSIVDPSIVEPGDSKTMASTDAITLEALAQAGVPLAFCQDKGCVEAQLPQLQPLVAKMVPAETENRQRVVEKLVSKLDFLTAAEQAEISQRLLTAEITPAVTGVVSDSTAVANAPANNADAAKVPAADKSTADGPVINIGLKEAENTEDVAAEDRYSLLHWAEGVFKDLGLGLSWAALYFTLFTTLWRGKTPGKWLFRLRVVRLTGKPMTLWTSFTRYGGYGAGFATGLLGFLQVYWDDNRQCIQDKIGETVVLQEDSWLGQIAPQHTENTASAAASGSTTPVSPVATRGVVADPVAGDLSSDSTSSNSPSTNSSVANHSVPNRQV